MAKQKMKTISIKITEADYQILCHELIDPKIWVENAVAGKINNVRKRLIPKAIQELIADPAIETIPANNDEICSQLFNKPSFKNAKVRQEEAAAELERMLDKEK